MTLVKLYKAWLDIKRAMPKGGLPMNTNLVHNILNAATWIIGLLGLILTYSGCSALPNGNYDCTASGVIPPSLLPIILLLTTVMAISKTVINLTRDGLGGLMKVQPPVSDTTKTVVVPAPDGAVVKVNRPAPGKKN
jgi:hypothetical protein